MSKDPVISINIEFAHGQIATLPAEQMNKLCVDSKVGLGDVAEGLSRCCRSMKGCSAEQSESAKPTS